jgi:tetratricopeptide (TPR) repeat protein
MNAASSTKRDGAAAAKGGRRPAHPACLFMLLLAAGCAGVGTAVKVPPGADAATHARAGAALLDGGRYDEAVAEFTASLSKDPGQPAVHVNRALAYQGKNEADKALADADRAIELDPSSDAAYDARGYLHYRQGRLEPALADLDKALRLNFMNQGAYNHRGLVHRAMGEHGQAIRDFNKAVDIDPSFYKAYANLAETLEKSGRSREAASAWENFVRSAPPSEEKSIEKARGRIKALRE